MQWYSIHFLILYFIEWIKSTWFVSFGDQLHLLVCLLVNQFDNFVCSFIYLSPPFPSHFIFFLLSSPLLSSQRSLSLPPSLPLVWMCTDIDRSRGDMGHMQTREMQRYSFIRSLLSYTDKEHLSYLDKEHICLFILHCHKETWNFHFIVYIW